MSDADPPVLPADPAVAAHAPELVVAGILDPGKPGRKGPVTPAMEAGITDHVWSVEEIAGLFKS